MGRDLKFNHKAALQNDDLNKAELYNVVKPNIPQRVINSRNKKRQWAYGYDEKYDVVIISKDGTIGEVYEINNLKIALPEEPANLKKGKNKWIATDCPRELTSMRTIFDWNKRDNTFKNKWVDYIEGEFDKREEGYWFKNNNTSTYITGTHYMYLQWTKIDVGRPDFREANFIFFGRLVRLTVDVTACVT